MRVIDSGLKLILVQLLTIVPVVKAHKSVLVRFIYIIQFIYRFTNSVAYDITKTAYVGGLITYLIVLSM